MLSQIKEFKLLYMKQGSKCLRQIRGKVFCHNLIGFSVSNDNWLSDQAACFKVELNIKMLDANC